MKIGKDNKVLVDTLDVIEAKEYIYSLEKEIAHHKKVIKQARESLWTNPYLDGDEIKVARAHNRFCNLTIDECRKKIRETKKTIEQVRKLQQEGK